jgi:uncharacterized protein YndB with AHSA1/START domain
MPSNKDFKRLVRARMVKTGEAYTAARAVLLLKDWLGAAAEAAAAAGKSAASSSAAAPAASLADFAKLAGKSDQAIKAKTGCTWDRWVWALDQVKAHQWPHREIAKYVHEKYKIDGWWAQTVTVGYERIKGIREIGQRLSGEYQATKSRTIPVSLTRLYRAFSQPRLRSQWLPDVTIAVRKATPNKSMRITWENGTSVEVWFISKERSKAQVAIQHGKLTSKEVANRMKQFWTERLDALEQMLAPGGNGKR